MPKTTRELVETIERDYLQADNYNLDNEGIINFLDAERPQVEPGQSARELVGRIREVVTVHTVDGYTHSQSDKLTDTEAAALVESAFAQVRAEALRQAAERYCKHNCGAFNCGPSTIGPCPEYFAILGKGANNGRD